MDQPEAERDSGEMELKVIETPGREWDEFASRHTDLIFYQSVWSEALRKGLGGQPLYFYLQEGGETVAGLPAVLLRFGVFRILYASIPYGNLIGEKVFFPPLMELLEREFQRRGIDQVRMTESPFFESYRPNAFKSISAKVTLLNLRQTDKEKVWEGYKKYIRRDIRKAQKSGVTIRSGSSVEDTKLFYDLYLASMERNRAAAKYPFEWFKTLCEGGPGKSLGTVRLAVLNQTALAGVVLVHSFSATHYFHNGSKGEYLKYCPNELLVHGSIEDAIDRGASFFDFMGSDRNDQNLIHFKEKWGSQSKDVHTYIENYHPIRCKMWEWGKKMAATNFGSKVARRFRGKLQ
jgi:hypothetical protein